MSLAAMRPLKLVGIAAAMILIMACHRGVDQETFAPVYRAAQDMQGATAVGVTLIRYRELLGTFASQVAQARDHVRSDRERLMVDQYAVALACYLDAAALWDAKNEHAMKEGFLYLDFLPNSDTLIKKYGLRVQPSPYRPELQVLHAEDAIHDIWRRAGQALAMANTAYTGK